MYRIREVDGVGKADILKALHRQTFDRQEAPMGDFLDGYWWIVYLGSVPVAFAGVCQAYHHSDVGYFVSVELRPFRDSDRLPQGE